jgi:hypothetical protein
LEVALAVQQEVDARFAETDTLRRQRVERARYEAELARRRFVKVDPDHRLVADSLEAEWNEKLRAYAAAQEECERQRQQRRWQADEETRRQVLSLANDFPRIWNDPEIDPRERKRMLRLLIEDVTLLKTDKITVNVRLRGGAMRSLVLDRPVPISQIRKAGPDLVAEIDRLLDDHCDREIADILNEQGRRTWQDLPFTLKKVAWLRAAYHLKSHFDRLRERGWLTAKQMSESLGISQTTVYEWAQSGLLRRLICDRRGHSLFEPLQNAALTKGHGGRGAKLPTFSVAESGQGAI